ncbi:MAG TPA: NAD(P)-dependent oxidoreductase [Acidimicrobiia bacterium]|nr:NAD(P)-dependent oxidoreductase [Acidimicrobiia bacterium]
MTRFGITVYGCEHDEAARFDDLAPRLGIVPTITRVPVSETTVVAVPANRCISVGHTSAVTGSVLRTLRDAGVEYVSTRSIGFDHIDLDAAADLGITVENVVYAPDGVADFTLMLILMAIRNAKQVARAADRHDFRLGARGKDLRDMTVGVVGVGHIGTAVVERLRGFGCRVLASNHGRNTPVAAELVSLDELLRESDVVTLHVPLNRDTHHFIGREQLDTMKPGAVLVNTGRGALVDTDALITALERGQLGAVALDVLEGEDGIFYSDCSTRPVGNQFLVRLQQLPNAIITPHTAYYTRRTLHDIVEHTLVNALSFERNRTHGETHDRDLVRGMFGGA